MLNIKQAAKEFFTLIKLHISHNWKIIAIIPFMAAITIPDVIELIRRQDPCDRSLKSEVPCGSCLNWR